MDSISKEIALEVSRIRRIIFCIIKSPESPFVNIDDRAFQTAGGCTYRSRIFMQIYIFMNATGKTKYISIGR